MLYSAHLFTVLTTLCILAPTTYAKVQAYAAKHSSDPIRNDPNNNYKSTITCGDGTYCAYPPK